jgi:hypothetical protein
LAYQSSAAVPFEAEIVVDGDLEPNNNGITQASQILTVAERTFSFTGIIQISDVSDAFLTTTDIGLVGTGQDADTALESMEYGAVVVPSLTSNYATRFARLASMARTAEASAIETRKARELEENEPVIGVPDGIRYEVLYVTSTYKATPLCGFNDLGIMNTGIFMVECRQYTNYVNGVPAAQWQELVETFSSCFLT